ncbi:MAG: DUF4288 domain-containing protein [Chloracidobacterium sp.]|nr:DUF4288 domain-containing protein [Chloracidobacterium sp.]
MKKSWYSAKCIFRHPETKSRRQIYEERILLVKADNSDSAIEKAEKNARQYSKDLENCEFASLVDVFELFDEKVGDKTEVYSAMRTSDLVPDDYLNQFYPEAPEDCELVGQKHRWYKKDSRHKGCYHCRVVK